MGYPLIIIGGPTATGKSDLAIQSAKNLNGEIISADSMQVYRHMDIGTAKIKDTEGIAHHFIDILDPKDAYSVGEFSKAGKACIREIHQRGKVPIVAGGTGLFIHSLIYRLNELGTPPNTEYRRTLENIVEGDGVEGLYPLLKEAGISEDDVDYKNPRRVIRALEIVKGGGSLKKKLDERDPDFEPLFYVLTMDRPLLYERIHLRIDQMLEDGLVQEVAELLENGCDESHSSMKAIGYKEVIGYLKGESSYDTMVEQLKQNSRNYAKRQLTWFRRYPDVVWLDVSTLSAKDIEHRITNDWKDRYGSEL